ncbi:hypothetical protein P8452_20954 [Trifolium repens]|nr:hypothetical protein P8452_20954 [Trifolium repens]
MCIWPLISAYLSHNNKRFIGRKISKVDEESNQVPCRVIRDGNCNVKFDPLFSCSLLRLTAADVVRNKSLMQMW